MCSRRTWQSVSCCGARLTNTWPDRKRFVFTEFRSPNGYYRAAIGCTAVWTFSVHCVSSLNKSTVTCGDEIRSSGQGSGGGGLRGDDVSVVFKIYIFHPSSKFVQSRYKQSPAGKLPYFKNE